MKGHLGPRGQFCEGLWLCVYSLYYCQFPGHGALFFQLYPHVTATFLCTRTILVVLRLVVSVAVSSTVCHAFGRIAMIRPRFGVGLLIECRRGFDREDMIPERHASDRERDLERAVGDWDLCYSLYMRLWGAESCRFGVSHRSD